MAIWDAAQTNGELIREMVKEQDLMREFSLEAAAAMLNIDVHYRNDLPAGTSGMIIKLESEDRARAYINANDSLQRQRFTLAHELGHYVERMVEAKDDEFSFSDSRSSSHYDLHEFYADQFAGGLLMPEAEVKKVTPSLTDALAVSLHFDVSVPAARKRLERLKKQQTLGQQ